MTPRKYKVWWPDDGQTKDDARVFEGFDHEHAAAEWAEWYDHHSADYSIVGGTAAEVQVLREDECSARAVLVTGQLSRTYSGHVLTANMSYPNIRFNAQFLREAGYPLYMAVYLLARKAG